jgi:hypothetical protein
MLAYAEDCVGHGYTIGRHERTDALANSVLLQAVTKYLKEEIH